MRCSRQGIHIGMFLSSSVLYVELETLNELKPAYPDSCRFLQVPNVGQAPVINSSLEGGISEDVFKLLQAINEAACLSLVG